MGTTEVAWIDEGDFHVNPIGAKWIGELGSAAIANAVYPATGVRVRDLPITLDKLLRRSPWSEHRTQIDILGKSERKLRITPRRSFRSLIPAVPFWEEEAGGLSFDQIVSRLKPSLGHIPIQRGLSQNDG